VGGTALEWLVGEAGELLAGGEVVGALARPAQALMPHSRAELTLDAHQQFFPESQRQAMETRLPGLVL